jgi:hypothetical protein
LKDIVELVYEALEAQKVVAAASTAMETYKVIAVSPKKAGADYVPAQRDDDAFAPELW